VLLNGGIDVGAATDRYHWLLACCWKMHFDVIIDPVNGVLEFDPDNPTQDMAS
jgi:hypothetical protein